MPKAQKEKNPETSGTAIAWCFTLYGWDGRYEDFKKRLHDKVADGTIKYAHFQPEVGEETGTLHFQGYLHRK